MSGGNVQSGGKLFGMKQIEVAAAVIVRGDRVFAVQRGYGDFKGGWEFPGGKIEAGETPQQALKREIMEEHNSLIEPGELLGIIDYDYPAFHLKMYCYCCELISGRLELLEAEDAAWLKEEELSAVDWLPADRSLIPAVGKMLKNRQSKNVL